MTRASGPLPPSTQADSCGCPSHCCQRHPPAGRAGYSTQLGGIGGGVAGYFGAPWPSAQRRHGYLALRARLPHVLTAARTANVAASGPGSTMSGLESGLEATTQTCKARECF